MSHYTLKYFSKLQAGMKEEKQKTGKQKIISKPESVQRMFYRLNRRVKENARLIKENTQLFNRLS
jgi:hypothetical protein